MNTSPISYNNKRRFEAIEHSTNKDWHEIISTAKIGDCMKIKTEILANKPKKEIDIKNIVSADDLKSVQRQDPFLYYSIPGVRSAKLLMKDIDLSNLGDTGAMSRNHITSPSRQETVQANDDDASQSQRVSRSSRISFECHPDLILEDLLDFEEDFDLEGSGEESRLGLDFLMASF